MNDEGSKPDYKSKLFIPLIILAIIICALFLKLKDFNELYNSEVSLTTQDAFRYARWAEEIKNGTFGEIDYLINVPDYGVNLNPPPLPSLLAVWLSNLFNIELKFLFIVLPPLLSILFIIPMYFWLRTFLSSPALYFVFPAGAMLGIFNLNYFTRTRIGYFDTDCLIFFFIFTIIMFISFSFREKENIYKSYINLLLAGLSFKLFMWWYYMPLMVLFFAFSLLAGLIVNRFPIRDILMKALIFFLLILTPQLAYDLFDFAYVYIFGAVMKLTDPIVSDIYSNIQELAPVSFNTFVSFTTDNKITFVIAIIGLALFLIKNLKHMILVLPFIIIGALSYKMGIRYTIYIAPFIGMGLAYALYLTFNYLSSKYSRYAKGLTVAGIVFAIFISFPGQIIRYENKPAYLACNFRGMSELSKITEKNSYILTWWDFGNPIEYLAKRATFINNTQAYPQKLYFMTRAFMTTDEQIARNLIAFIANNPANSYIKDIKHSGIDYVISVADKYDKDAKAPVYVTLNQYMLSMSVIHGIGLNDEAIKTGKEKVFGDFFKCEPVGNEKEIFDCVYTAFHEGKKDTLIRNDADAKRAYKEIYYIDRQVKTTSLINLNEQAPNNTVLYIIKAVNGDLYSLPVTEKARYSVYNRMFILGDKFHSFELVYDDFPFTVVYKVK